MIYYSYFISNIGLGIQDLNDVLTKLRNADYDNTKWRKLGLELGLRAGTLAVIDQNYPRDADRCLDECLTKWLQRADNVDEYGMPTYNVLATALYNIDQKASAAYIRKYIFHTYNSNSNGHHYYSSLMHFVCQNGT